MSVVNKIYVIMDSADRYPMLYEDAGWFATEKEALLYVGKMQEGEREYDYGLFVQELDSRNAESFLAKHLQATQEDKRQHEEWCKMTGEHHQQAMEDARTNPRKPRVERLIE